jgi:hypothetical protein
MGMVLAAGALNPSEAVGGEGYSTGQGVAIGTIWPPCQWTVVT